MNLAYVYGVIYVITNLINGKVYVGLTTHGIKQRLSNHLAHAFGFITGKYKGKDTPLFRAMRKYGRESFKIEMVCSCSTKEELDLMEDLYIFLLGGYNKNTGYNIRRGGGNGKMSEEVRKTCGYAKGTFKHSPESKQRMSESTKKFLAANPRPPISETTREKMRNRPHPVLSEEVRQNMRERFSGAGGTNFYSNVPTQQLVELYALNYSCFEIAKAVPMTSAGVRARLKSVGTEMRSCSSRAKPLVPIEEYVLIDTA